MQVPKSGSVIALTDLEDRLLIGKGSSGAVYKARHKSTKAIYAVKVTAAICDFLLEKMNK